MICVIVSIFQSIAYTTDISGVIISGLLCFQKSSMRTEIEYLE